MPYKNRLENLSLTLPTLFEAANASPPIEIVIVDYNSDIPLENYLKNNTPPLDPHNFLLVYRYTGNPYFHMAHSRNVANKISHGAYLTQGNVDMLLHPSYFQIMRDGITPEIPLYFIAKTPVSARYNSCWHPQIMVVERNEFMSAGGFDERFEFWGAEDKDLNARLLLRGLPYKLLPLTPAFQDITTPRDLKTKNYRLPLHLKRMSNIQRALYKQNILDNILVANPGQSWGDPNKVFTWEETNEIPDKLRANKETRVVLADME